METDLFQSHTISLVLSWLFSIPVLIGITFALIGMLFEKQDDVPRLFLIWLIICVIIFSPARYMIFQYFVSLAYPFQSFSAFISMFYLIIFIPIVFSILYGIGLALPFLASLYISFGLKKTISKVRLAFGMVIAPFIFILGSYLFYTILPYAAYATHSLKAKDLIRATNGPAEYFYKYVVYQWTPIQLPQFTDDIGLNNLSTKEILRAHVAAVYLGKKQFVYYVDKAYPEYFENKELAEAKPQKKWPELTKEEQSELSEVSIKIVQGPLSEKDLEIIRRISKSYSKRVGRSITDKEIKLITQAFDTLCKYNYELGLCMLKSFDTKQPFISDDLKSLRIKMENMSQTRKTKLDADFRRIVSVANREVWSDEDGKEYHPLSREEILEGLNQTKIMNENINKYIDALKN